MRTWRKAADKFHYGTVVRNLGIKSDNFLLSGLERESWKMRDVGDVHALQDVSWALTQVDPALQSVLEHSGKELNTELEKRYGPETMAFLKHQDVTIEGFLLPIAKHWKNLNEKWSEDGIAILSEAPSQEFIVQCGLYVVKNFKVGALVTVPVFPEQLKTRPSFKMFTKDCKHCSGTGVTRNKRPCPTCDTEGRVPAHYKDGWVFSLKSNKRNATEYARLAIRTGISGL